MWVCFHGDFGWSLRFFRLAWLGYLAWWKLPVLADVVTGRVMAIIALESCYLWLSFTGPAVIAVTPEYMLSCKSPIAMAALSSQLLLL